LTAEAREKLRRYGIAPPNGHASLHGSASLHGHASQTAEGAGRGGVVSNVVLFSRCTSRTDDVACPQCNSSNTRICSLIFCFIETLYCVYHDVFTLFQIPESNGPIIRP
jgi:hypothetical protein